MTDLLRTVSRRASLFRAWRKIRDNGLHSPSKETREEVVQFDAVAVTRLDKLQHHLTRGRFEFRPQRGIAKRRRGKTARPLVVAAIENRIVQRSILDTLQALPQFAKF
jgi:RNA-directed DNA polymerase